jgi:hypothetical protein
MIRGLDRVVEFPWVRLAGEALGIEQWVGVVTESCGSWGRTGL